MAGRVRQALVVMDVTVGSVAHMGAKGEEFVSSITSTVGAARRAGLPVIFTRLGFRDGAPEMSARNRLYSLIYDGDTLKYPQDSPETQVHPALQRRDDEVVVVKRRVSAFSGSDLEVVLRGLDVESIAMCGTATSAVILATFLQAADLDYDVVVIEDCCADSRQDLHRACLDGIFPRQGRVVSVDTWSREIGGSAG